MDNFEKWGRDFGNKIDKKKAIKYGLISAGGVVVSGILALGVYSIFSLVKSLDNITK